MKARVPDWHWKALALHAAKVPRADIQAEVGKSERSVERVLYGAWGREQRREIEARAYEARMAEAIDPVVKFQAAGPRMADIMLQAAQDESQPLKRAIMPNGGLKMVTNGLEAYGYKPDPKVIEIGAVAVENGAIAEEFGETGGVAPQRDVVARAAALVRPQARQHRGTRRRADRLRHISALKDHAKAPPKIVGQLARDVEREVGEDAVGARPVNEKFSRLAFVLYLFFINLGSAVILPEVFLKALSLVRNLGHDVKRFTTLNMDFIRHYRPMTNVVSRPTLEGGEGYSLVGHHEIMFPLLAAAVIERLEGGT